MYKIIFNGNLSEEDKAKGRTQIHTDSALGLVLREGESVNLDAVPDWAQESTWEKIGKANPFTIQEVIE